MAVSSAACHGVALGIVCRVGYQESGCRKEGVAASGRAKMRGLHVLYLGGLQEARQVADGQFVVPYSRGGAASDVIGRGSYRIHGAYARARSAC